MIIDDKYRNRVYVALLRAQGDILEQLKDLSVAQREKLREEYKDLEIISRNIQREFDKQ